MTDAQNMADLEILNQLDKLLLHPLEHSASNQVGLREPSEDNHLKGRDL